ncbi:EAL domain-containing protein [sulfur-oxidizing endosymbiont of Gigantopelta aegis]|uniref:EAL domain-containing protein n=1 Tax=sulfur-oxidizing endosymbiont of Gigantopelta aegis TaxID=2794934 RepID=UPI0031B5E7B4
MTMTKEVNDELIDKEAVLFIVKQALKESTTISRENRNKTLHGIASFLDHGLFDDEVAYDYEDIIKLLINGYSLADKQAIIGLNKENADPLFVANRAIAMRMNINDFVLFKQSNQSILKSIRIQLTWMSDARNVFVFTDKAGKQHAVFNLNEVVSMLSNGQLSQTRDYDLPILERSLYNILGDVHDDMAKESTLDDVSGLINQKEFISKMHEMFDQRSQLEVGANNSACVICHIDIDQFSLINDTCGYEAGDYYISQISQIIKQNFAENVIIARYGIDEFILLLPEYSQTKALQIAEEKRLAISEHHFKWDEKEFALTASIGLVSITEENEVDVYLKAVVTATTIAKEMGRNRVHYIEYDAIELNHRQELQIWATKIEQMVNDNMLDIRCQLLQPLNNESREIKLVQHYEMLLLVKDDNDKFIPPAEFIEAAELYNKMVDVDRWVIRYVLDWFSKNPEQLAMMGGIAINLSGQSLNDVNFYPFIVDIFAEFSDIPHDLICFEITETMAIHNVSYATNIIHSIKEMGCKFALDDFGTGLSSYAYLKNLPVDYLKIDGVFIKDIVNNSADRAMVKSINEIGHFLGMKTVAEYVENEEIVTVLEEIGVDYAQGYGVEKPILISEFMAIKNGLETRP